MAKFYTVLSLYRIIEEANLVFAPEKGPRFLKTCFFYIFTYFQISITVKTTVLTTFKQELLQVVLYIFKRNEDPCYEPLDYQHS